jgi:hypothetical protein
MSAPSTSPAATTTREQRGELLQMLRTLLEAGEVDAVVELVTKLVARNSELERRLADFLTRGHKREGVSSDQLKLFLDGLAPECAADLDTANAQLRAAAGLDAAVPPDEPTTEEPCGRMMAGAWVGGAGAFVFDANVVSVPGNGCPI